MRKRTASVVGFLSVTLLGFLGAACDIQGYPEPKELSQPCEEVGDILEAEYTGPAGTEQGNCHGATLQCSTDKKWVTIELQQTPGGVCPTAEEQDNNCDGKPDVQICTYQRETPLLTIYTCTYSCEELKPSKGACPPKEAWVYDLDHCSAQ